MGGGGAWAALCCLVANEALQEGAGLQRRPTAKLYSGDIRSGPKYSLASPLLTCASDAFSLLPIALLRAREILSAMYGVWSISIS